jgi:hypothetical protein
MTGKVVPLHRALRHLPEPGSLLTLEEVRARMETPPAEPVEWVGTDLDSGREERTWAQHWKSARDIIAAKLGALPDRVECILADEQRLSGNGTA